MLSSGATPAPAVVHEASFCSIYTPPPLTDADIAALSRPAVDAMNRNMAVFARCPKR